MWYTKRDLGDNYLLVVKQYQYLCIVFDEFVDFNVTANVLPDAGNRALWGNYQQIWLSENNKPSSWNRTDIKRLENVCYS